MDMRKIKRILLKDIAKNKTIPEHEQIDLIKKIKNGESSQIDKLIKCNARFILKVALQHKTQNISIPELVNEGVIGMIHAAKRFDINSGNKFLSYAVWWIRQAMVKAINNRSIQIPSNITSNYSKLEKAKEKSLQELGCMDIKYIAKETGCTIKDVEGSFILQPISINSPLNRDSTTTVESLLVSEEEDIVQKIIKKEECKELLSCLNARQRKIVTLYFGFKGKTFNLEQIGEHLHISKERVRQLLQRAIKTMRGHKRK